MDNEIIKKLTDIKFAKKIVGLKTKKEVKKAFEDEGIEISDDQVDELGGQINLIVQETSKLPTEELEKIPGGLLEGLVNATNSTALSTVPGAAPPNFGGGQFSYGTIATVSGIATAGIGALGYFISRRSKNKPPPPTAQRQIVSNEAMAGAAIVLAVVGSGYVISQLVKSGWFSK